MNQITLTGLYKGDDPRGTIIGGRLFIPNNVGTTDVSEDVFERLYAAQENGWFQIIKHNYEEFLRANGRVEIEIHEAPADVPPADVPPADVPPADVPPADVPPADVPPANPIVITNLDEFVALSNTKQKAAIKNSTVSVEILNHIVENEAKFNATVVELAKAALV